mgnify:CR=1 FL=1|tara:strand:- start:6 stop:866 length:861 start_codon:yes stop_codon:yes gene_type:complete
MQQNTPLLGMWRPPARRPPKKPAVKNKATPRGSEFFVCPWCPGENKEICEKHGVGITAFYPNQKIVEKHVIHKKFKIEELHDAFVYYQSDKYKNAENSNNHPNYYVPVYQKVFNKFKDNELVNILEIGIGRGSSLKAYDSVFKKSNIIGIDINEGCKDLCKDYDNIKIIVGNVIYPSIRDEIHLDSIDIIIDDGSHMPDDMIRAFNNLFEYLPASGAYIIEDLTCCRNSEYLLSHPYTSSRYASQEEYLELNTEEKLLSFLDSLSKRDDILSVDRENDGIVVITKK